MTKPIQLWAPRVAGLALVAFFAMFSVGASAGSHGAGDRVMHLAPALLMLAIVVLGWRRPLLGGLAMLTLAILYASFTRRLDWALVISGPLLLTGALYVGSWRLVKRAVIVAVIVVPASPVVAHAQAGETVLTPPTSCSAPAPLPRCPRFIQAEGGIALQLFSRGSTVFDSTRASSSTGPFGAAPIPVNNLPSYLTSDVMAMWNTDSSHALGVSVHAGLMLGFTTQGGSDFLVRSAVSFRRRTWLPGDNYRDVSIGALIAQVEKLRHPSGTAVRPGVTAAVTWARKPVSFFASMDVVHADVEPRFAIHGGMKLTGGKPLVAATAIGAALIGLLNMPLS